MLAEWDGRSGAEQCSLDVRVELSRSGARSRELIRYGTGITWTVFHCVMVRQRPKDRRSTLRQQPDQRDPRTIASYATGTASSAPTQATCIKSKHTIYTTSHHTANRSLTCPSSPSTPFNPPLQSKDHTSEERNASLHDTKRQPTSTPSSRTFRSLIYSSLSSPEPTDTRHNNDHAPPGLTRFMDIASTGGFMVVFWPRLTGRIRSQQSRGDK